MVGGTNIPGWSKPIRIEEFELERAWWDNRVENEQAWRVSIDQIKSGNYNLDLKNPHNPDTGPGDVDHLLPNTKSFSRKSRKLVLR